VKFCLQTNKQMSSPQDKVNEKHVKAHTRLKALTEPGKNVEIELRFGTPRKTDPRHTHSGSQKSTTDENESNVVAGVSKAGWNRIKEFLDSSIDEKTEGVGGREFVHTIDKIPMGKIVDGYSRMTKLINGYSSVVDKWSMKKTRIDEFDLYDSAKLVLSMEEKKGKFEDGAFKLTRDKMRWIYKRLGGYEIHLTEVTKKVDGREPETVYELEVEFKSSKNVNQMTDVYNKLFKLLNFSRYVYSLSEKNEVIRDVNNALGVVTDDASKIMSQMIPKPRNITMDDIVGGGIVPHGNLTTDYYFTRKADGVGNFMVIRDAGIFLVSSTSQVSKIMEFDTSDMGTNLFTKKFSGTVVQGELVPSDNILGDTDLAKMARNRFFFLAFDILIYPPAGNSKNIATRNFRSRQKTLQILWTSIHEIIQPEVVLVIKKHYLLTPDNFFSEIERVLNLNVPYKTDGGVFTPGGVYDVSWVNSLRAKDRGLNKLVEPEDGSNKMVKLDELVKWKPPDQLTIDLAVRSTASPSGDLHRLYANRDIVFEGSSIMPMNSTVFGVPKNIDEFPSNSVFEFKWDTETKQLVSTRHRPDKVFPNNIETAVGVWNDIHRPITKAVITGKSTHLIRRYHSRVKKTLLEHAVKQVAVTGRKDVRLLSIGAGRGEIWKWRNAGATHVIAVEPDKDNMFELKKRVNKYNANQRNTPLNVSYLQATGQETDKILAIVNSVTGGKVDILEYMLSLSFFDPTSDGDMKSVEDLVNIIDTGGVFVALTIDGSVVREFFSVEDNYDTTDDGNKIARFGKVMDMMLREPVGLPATVFLNIPNSIVTEQNEYVTDLSVINDILTRSGMIIDGSGYTNEEVLLGSVEKMFGHMFRWHVARKK
jgi:hypothetical protein